MAAHRVGVTLKAAHDTFTQLIREVLLGTGLSPHGPDEPGDAEVILDFPLTWAFTQLDKLNSVEKARTLVTQWSTNLDCALSGE